MREPSRLTAIQVQVIDCEAYIPKGMRPVFLHLYGTEKWVAYVEHDSWSPDREHAGLFDLYPLDTLQSHIITLKSDEKQDDQLWYHNFPEPTREDIT